MSSVIVIRRDIPFLDSAVMRMSEALALEFGANVMSVVARQAPEKDLDESDSSSNFIYSLDSFRKIGLVRLSSDLMRSAWTAGLLSLAGKSGIKKFVETGQVLSLPVEDIFYDSLIRTKNRFLRPHLHFLAMVKTLLEIRIVVRWFDKNLDSDLVEAVCLTTLQSREGKTMAMRAVQAGVPVFVVGGSGSLARRHLTIESLQRSFYHLSAEEVDQVGDNDGWELDLDDYLTSRISPNAASFSSFRGDQMENGNLRTLSEANDEAPFRDKLVLSKASFIDEYIPANRQHLPLVVVFSHCFSDYPHSAGPLIFLDFYEALIETTRAIRQNKSVNWLIKPHPSREFYGEEGLVEKMLAKNPSDNTFLWPETVSTASALDWASGIVTVNGTIGLEAACFGKPVLLAGSSAYGHLGFSKVAKTPTEFFSHIANAHSWTNIPQSQRLTARKALYLHARLGSELPKSRGKARGLGGVNSVDYAQKVALLANGEVDSLWLNR